MNRLEFSLFCAIRKCAIKIFFHINIYSNEVFIMFQFVNASSHVYLYWEIVYKEIVTIVTSNDFSQNKREVFHLCLFHL